MPTSGMISSLCCRHTPGVDSGAVGTLHALDPHVHHKVGLESLSSHEATESAPESCSAGTGQQLVPGQVRRRGASHRSPALPPSASKEV